MSVLMSGADKSQTGAIITKFKHSCTEDVNKLGSEEGISETNKDH
jgi:hypothetical protein